MKIRRKQGIRYSALAVLFLLVLMLRISTGAAEGYSLNVYPYLSFLLSGFSSTMPFSIGDLFIFVSLLWVIAYPFYAWYKKHTWKRTLLQIAEFLLWIYVWFYLAWGVNYFRKDFYSRSHTKQITYSSKDFHDFLTSYVILLNNSYTPISTVDKAKVAEDIKQSYKRRHKLYGLASPYKFQQVKTMMFTPLISKMGISGYMGPFFSEFNLNGDLLPSQYASTYAHELAHLLGIANEAEANLYAYLACTKAANPQVRFSGYFSLLSHVLRNASNLLSEEEYIQLIESIRPETITLYEANRNYWESKYSPLIGNIQDIVYDWFLKGNNISNGTQNYSEVISLLIAVEKKERLIYWLRGVLM